MQITRYASVDDVEAMHQSLDLVHGQTHGAIAQGVGQAMSEQIYLDPDSGQPPLTGSLMDYACRAPTQLPAFATEIAEVLSSPTNPCSASKPAAKAAPPPRRPRSGQRHSRRAAPARGARE